MHSTFAACGTGIAANQGGDIQTDSQTDIDTVTVIADF